MITHMYNIRSYVVTYPCIYSCIMCVCVSVYVYIYIRTPPGKSISSNWQLVSLWALYSKTHVDVQTGFHVSRVGKESPRPSPHGDVRWAATPVTKWHQDGACPRIACGGCQVMWSKIDLKKWTDWDDFSVVLYQSPKREIFIIIILT